jgi:hypothetical protein
MANMITKITASTYGKRPLITLSGPFVPRQSNLVDMFAVSSQPEVSKLYRMTRPYNPVAVTAAILTLALGLGLGHQAQASSTLRTVLVTVVDRNRAPLVDLDADDFVVRESGQTREIFALRIADYPVVLLVDTSSGSRRDADAIRDAAARFITRVGQRPIAVGTLGSPPRFVAEFTDDRSTVMERLAQLAIDGSPDIPFLQAIAGAAGLVRDTGQPFAAIVVISAAPPPPIAGGPGNPGGPGGPGGNGQLGQIVDSRATVYVVANRAGAAPSPVDQLRGLSEQTHGQFTTIYSPDSYAIALEHLADQMASEMMIEFVVPPGAPPSSDATVGVRVPGAVVKGLGVR